MGRGRAENGKGATNFAERAEGGGGTGTPLALLPAAYVERGERTFPQPQLEPLQASGSWAGCPQTFCTSESRRSRCAPRGAAPRSPLPTPQAPGPAGAQAPRGVGVQGTPPPPPHVLPRRFSSPHHAGSPRFAACSGAVGGLGLSSMGLSSFLEGRFPRRSCARRSKPCWWQGTRTSGRAGWQLGEDGCGSSIHPPSPRDPPGSPSRAGGVNMRGHCHPKERPHGVKHKFSPFQEGFGQAQAGSVPWAAPPGRASNLQSITHRSWWPQVEDVRRAF